MKVTDIRKPEDKYHDFRSTPTGTFVQNAVNGAIYIRSARGWVNLLNGDTTDPMDNISIPGDIVTGFTIQA